MSKFKNQTYVNIREYFETNDGELKPGKKIVFTWQWEDDEDWENHVSIVTVELDDADGGTELRLSHEQLPNEESRDGHTRGWNSALDKLGKFFSR